jgi:hypothetical protein
MSERDGTKASAASNATRSSRNSISVSVSRPTYLGVVSILNVSILPSTTTSPLMQTHIYTVLAVPDDSGPRVFRFPSSVAKRIREFSKKSRNALKSHFRKYRLPGLHGFPLLKRHAASTLMVGLIPAPTWHRFFVCCVIPVFLFFLVQRTYFDG